jgi:TonB-linked SusC/RagA family outer membrane protein
MQVFAPCKIVLPICSKPKHYADYRKLTKPLLVMKITAILLLAATLQVSAKGWGQEKITLSFNNAPLDQVFNSIAVQTGIGVLYRPDYVKGKKVTINVTNADLKTVLDLCVKNQQLTYKITEKVVVIQPVKKNNSVSGIEVIENTPPLIDVHGRVVDEKKEPVSNVTVTMKGTNLSTSTDANGEFSLHSIDQNAVLVFTHVSMESFELKVSGKTELAISLKTKTSQLDDVQIIAYGQTTKRFQTGNITSIKSEVIQEQPITNPLLALQGRVPGLVITQANGISGGSINVLIQGQTSIGTTSNVPFYVINGVPYTSQLPYGIGSTSIGQDGVNGEGNPLFYINPSDIESIEVLKDADATAIYGSRAANGAILITTKRGKIGKPAFDINVQQGWGKVAHFMDMMNTQQYVQMRREALANDNLTLTLSNAKDLIAWDTTQYTNWQKVLMGGTAKYSNVYASVSGGTETIQYLVGGTYRRQTTVYPGDFSDESGSFHFNLSQSSVNKKFHLQLSGNYTTDNNKLPGIDLTQTAVLLAPDAPSLYNADGTLNWGLTSIGRYTYYNPVGNLQASYTNKTNNLVSSAQLGYNILPGLDIKSNFGYTNLQTNDLQLIPLMSRRPDLRGTFYTGQSVFGSTTISSWIAEPQLTYNRNIGKGLMELLVGTTFQKNNGSVESVYGSGYSSDLLLQSIQAAPTVFGTKNYTYYKYNAFFGRLNYNWLHEYVINAALRRDGSSRFGEKNRFHDFASVGTAWIFTEEKSIHRAIPFLSFGKLKASYGSTGNDQFADYAYVSAYTSTFADVPYQDLSGLYVSGIANPYIKWEETRKLMMGMSLGFLNDRFILDATYSRNRTSNEILSYALPSVTGFTAITYYNFPASVENTSWEFMLNANIFKKKHFDWETSFNLTIPSNKLRSFPNIENTPYASGLSGVIIGQPLGVQKIFQYMGVDPSTGLYSVADLNGTPTTSPDFSTGYTGLTSPRRKFYGGFQNSITYKAFQLDFFIEFVNQTGKNIYSYYNGNTTPGTFNTYGTVNQPAAVFYNHWGKSGDNVSIQKYSTDQLGPIVVASDAGYSSDLSFLRLKTLSFSWNLPVSFIQMVHIQRARIYAQGQNLLTFTKFKGLDPETGVSLVLPPLRMIVIGLQLNF